MAKTLKHLVEQRLADKSFLEGLVKEPVEGFSLCGNSEGGFMGTIKPMVIKTKSGATHHIVYKGISHESDKLFSLFIHFKFFERENLFYKIIAPGMEKLCKSPLPIAKMYDCHNDGKTDFVVLEDLRPLGYTSPERYPGLSFDETEMILQQLGAFHAKGFHYLQEESRGNSRQDFSLLSLHYTIAKDEPSNPHWPSYNKVCVDVFGVIKDRFSADLASKVDTICSRALKYITLPWKLCQEGKYFSVICHGDLWATNIFFRYSQETKKPLDVKFIDFQNCHKGSIYSDLYSFIFTSTSPEFRKEHLKTILDIYYDAFVQELQRIGTQHLKYFTREKFNQEFFDSAVSGLAKTVFAIPFHLGVFPQQDNSTTKNEIETQNNELKIVPLVDAFSDFNTLCPIAFKNSERAMKRLEDVIREFSEMNIL